MNTDKIAGKAKDVTGKVTGNKKLQMKGKAQELRGAAKDKMHEASEHMSHKADHRMQNK